MKIDTVIKMDPVGKGRPRCTRGGRMYTPAATVKAEKTIRDAFRDQHPQHIPFEKGVPLRVRVDAYFAQAKSNKTKEMTQKPDADNIGKLVDALNEVAWADDSQIVEMVITKQWTKGQPKLVIGVETT